VEKSKKVFENIDSFWADFNSHVEYGGHKFDAFEESVLNNETPDGTHEIFIDAEESTDGHPYSFLFSLRTDDDSGVQRVTYIGYEKL